MNTRDTAVILIGYQNDYFSGDGVLYDKIEYPKQVLRNTINLIDNLQDSDILIITTPIIFTPNYSELDDPVGILQIIKDVGAFKKGTKGSETLPEISEFGDRIMEIPGKIGLNAFADTHLHEVLQSRGIKNIVLAGAVTSICIDSTGRSAFEKGYKVHHLCDCSSARTSVEHSFYCNTVFPIYARNLDAAELLKELGIEEKK